MFVSCLFFFPKRLCKLVAVTQSCVVPGGVLVGGSHQCIWVGFVLEMPLHSSWSLEEQRRCRGQACC